MFVAIFKVVFLSLFFMDVAISLLDTSPLLVSITGFPSSCITNFHLMQTGQRKCYSVLVSIHNRYAIIMSWFIKINRCCQAENHHTTAEKEGEQDDSIKSTVVEPQKMNKMQKEGNMTFLLNSCINVRKVLLNSHVSWMFAMSEIIRKRCFHLTLKPPQACLKTLRKGFWILLFPPTFSNAIFQNMQQNTLMETGQTSSRHMSTAKKRNVGLVSQVWNQGATKPVKDALCETFVVCIFELKS